MKKILLTSLVLGLMVISQPVISQVSEMDVIEASNKQEIRSLALDQNGVKIFFVETSENEKRFLTILFKNTNSIDNDLIWSLKHENNYLITHSPIKLLAGEEHNLDRKVELKPNQLISDFNVEIKK